MSDEQRKRDAETALVLLRKHFYATWGGPYEDAVNEIADDLATARREALEQSAVVRFLAHPNANHISRSVIDGDVRWYAAFDTIRDGDDYVATEDGDTADSACSKALAWLEANGG